MTTRITVNGKRAISGAISLPRVGVWSVSADVDADSTDGLDKDATVVVGDDELTLKGTVVHTYEFHGRVTVSVLGGKAGFGKPCEPKFYRSVPTKIPIEDVLKVAGESLASDADKGAIGKQLEFWAREAGSCGRALRALLDPLSLSWRVKPDGTVWIGKETWPKAKVDSVQVLTLTGASRAVVFSTPSPIVLPGTELEGRKLDSVTHFFSPDKIVSEALFV